MKNIISASRRTDIPRFYARWFSERRKAGWVEFRNAFGGAGHVSLLNHEVVGYLFWTRYAHPFLRPLRDLLDEGLPCAFQYTINGYGRELEPHVPFLGRALDDFGAVSAMLPSPHCIQWRYDPIVLSDRYSVDFHLQCFGEIAAALNGATWVVNTSVVEPYLKTVRRMGDPTVHYRVLDPQRHRTVAARNPSLGQAAGDVELLLKGLSQIAEKQKMELRLCSNPELQMPASQCCSIECFEPYGAEVARQVASLRQGPSRTACRCVKTVDIGMDNTCVAGCRYCYAVQSHEAALRNFKKASPSASRLR